jgi:hypothetical protein
MLIDLRPVGEVVHGEDLIAVRYTILGDCETVKVVIAEVRTGVIGVGAVVICLLADIVRVGLIFIIEGNDPVISISERITSGDSAEIIIVKLCTSILRAIDLSCIFIVGYLAEHEA